MKGKRRSLWGVVCFLATSAGAALAQVPANPADPAKRAAIYDRTAHTLVICHYSLFIDIYAFPHDQ